MSLQVYHLHHWWDQYHKQSNAFLQSDVSRRMSTIDEVDSVIGVGKEYII